MRRWIFQFVGDLISFTFCIFILLFFWFIRTSMVARIFILIAVCAFPQPRASHAKLIRRFCFIRTSAIRSSVLLWVSCRSWKRQSSSKKLRINWNILIFSSMSWKLLIIHAQFHGWTTTTEQVFGFWSSQFIRIELIIMITISGTEC